ncbi:hypothetical protein GWK47_053157 [Chionoecetes opilio]|uniref:Uncharacterized protein n=1 Tax=Chionoecetes opilio TaxID=41210 RepID=A0A8J5C9B1_CHIOP|nr:hypothetical protein GWK47_053157 [Chionoecetes opilio]
MPALRKKISGMKRILKDFLPHSRRSAQPLRVWPAGRSRHLNHRRPGCLSLPVTGSLTAPGVNAPPGLNIYEHVTSGPRETEGTHYRQPPGSRCTTCRPLFTPQLPPADNKQVRASSVISALFTRLLSHLRHTPPDVHNILKILVTSTLHILGKEGRGSAAVPTPRMVTLGCDPRRVVRVANTYAAVVAGVALRYFKCHAVAFIPNLNEGHERRRYNKEIGVKMCFVGETPLFPSRYATQFSDKRLNR